MRARTFSILVVASTLMLVAAAWLLAWWFEPLYGDLTRLGGYPERDFGWNRPIEEFDPPITSFGEWTRPVDILVIGDSFANLRPRQQWQNHLAARTGWRIHTLDVHHVDVAQLVRSSIYVGNPPKVVIWNIVERDLVGEYGRKQSECPKAVPTSPVGLATPAKLPSGPVAVMRSRSWSSVNPGFVRTWLFRQAWRRASGADSGGSLRQQLARQDLFSSRITDQLLVYDHDQRKGAWKPVDLDAVRCALAKIALKFQANGSTVFVTALAPDKSSAYRPWLRAPEKFAETRLPDLLERFPVPDARLDVAVRKAVSCGVKDVYMPDDTHWGGAGQALAAEAIMELLARLRTIVADTGSPSGVQGIPAVASAGE